MGRHVAPIESDGLPELGDRLIKLAFLSECLAEVAVGPSEAVLESDGLPELGDRLVELARFLEFVAEVVVEFSECRLQPDGLAVRGDRLVQPPLVVQGVAEVAVALRVAAVEPVGLPELGDRLVELTIVFQGEAKVDVRPCAPRLQGHGNAGETDFFHQTLRSQLFEGFGTALVDPEVARVSLLPPRHQHGYAFTRGRARGELSQQHQGLRRPILGRVGSGECLDCSRVLSFQVIPQPVSPRVRVDGPCHRQALSPASSFSDPAVVSPIVERGHESLVDGPRRICSAAARGSTRSTSSP